jgi:hypothetical protein
MSMSSVIRASTIEDQPQITGLLTRVFGVGPDADFVDPAMLRWKYYEPRSDWPDPRSLVMENAGRIVAHVGLWPVTVRTDTGTERGVHMIDWVADPETPGAGVALLWRIKQSYDFVYGIGGSEMAQTVLAKFGFLTVANALTFARPLRPLRQILLHQRRDARLPLRLLRNVWWSRIPARKMQQEWSFAALTDDREGSSMPSGERDAGFFRYLRQCPVARFLGFHILHEGRKSGFFALAVVGEQARLAGVVLEKPDPAYWRIAFSLAQDAVLSHTTTSELVVRTTAETAFIAATQSGMRMRKQTPVFVYRKKDGGDTLPLHYQLWDNDSIFLGSRQPEFLT